MKNVQPPPEHVRAELVQGELLHGGRWAIREPSLRVLNEERRVEIVGSKVGTTRKATGASTSSAGTEH